MFCGDCSGIKMMNSTEAQLKLVALEKSGDERWRGLVNLYEAKAQATLDFLQNISEDNALKPVVAGRTLIEVVDHIRAWDQWETDAGLISIASGIKKPQIMKFRNFVDRQGLVSHYDYLPSHQAVDRFNQERAEELDLFLKYRGLTWPFVVEELRQITNRLAAAARDIPAEVAEQAELHLWRVLGEPVPHAVYLVAVSTFHVAIDGEYGVDFNLAGVNNFK